MGASSRTNSSHRGARPSVRRTSRRRARERVHSRSRRRSPRLRALDPRGPQRDPPTGIASNHGRRHEVPTLSWRLVSRGTSMSTGPILIPPPALDPGERRGPVLRSHPGRRSRDVGRAQSGIGTGDPAGACRPTEGHRRYRAVTRVKPCRVHNRSSDRRRRWSRSDERSTPPGPDRLTPGTGESHGTTQR